MFHSPWFRRILCVILAVVFCCSAVLHPLEARAVDPVTAAVVGVAASIAIPSIMIGLGLMPGTNLDAFHNLASSIASKLDAAWTFTSAAGVQMINMLCLKNNYFAQHELVQNILDLFFAPGSAASLSSYYFPYPASGAGSFAPFEAGLKNGISYFSLQNYKSWIIVDNGTSARLFLSSDDQIYFFSNSNGTYITLGSNFCAYTDGTCAIYQNGTLYLDGYTYTYGTLGYSLMYQSAADLAIGNLAEDLAAPKYDEWRKTQIIEFPTTYNPDDPENPDYDEDSGLDPSKYLALILAGTAATVGILTQDYVQRGGESDLTYTDVEKTGKEIQIDVANSPGIQNNPSLNPDTNTNPDTGTDTNPDTNPDSGSSGNGGFNNSTEVNPGRFQFDFKKLFPFCIPFDLYAMLNALQAEPVAPAFTLGIPFLGRVYTFQVDLSAWNDIASVLRTCQVAIFCIGLTQATRKYIKW